MSTAFCPEGKSKKCFQLLTLKILPDTGLLKKGPIPFPFWLLLFGHKVKDKVGNSEKRTELIACPVFFSSRHSELSTLLLESSKLYYS